MFSMQVVISKCFLLNPERKKKKKLGADSSCRKTQNRSTPTHSNSKNDVTKPKARLL